jgi:hypothetical protein
VETLKYIIFYLVLRIYIRNDKKKISIVLLRNKIIWRSMVLGEINFERVADPYAHYDDSEDIFSIPTDVVFPLQHMLLVSLMVTPK